MKNPCFAERTVYVVLTSATYGSRNLLSDVRPCSTRHENNKEKQAAQYYYQELLYQAVYRSDLIAGMVSCNSSQSHPAAAIAGSSVSFRISSSDDVENLNVIPPRNMPTVSLGLMGMPFTWPRRPFRISRTYLFWDRQTRSSTGVICFGLDSGVHTHIDSGRS